MFYKEKTIAEVVLKTINELSYDDEFDRARKYIDAQNEKCGIGDNPLGLRQGEPSEITYLDKDGNDISLRNRRGEIIGFKKGVDGRCALNSATDVALRNNEFRLALGKNEYDLKLEDVMNEEKCENERLKETLRKDKYNISYGFKWNDYKELDNEADEEFFEDLEKYLNE